MGDNRLKVWDATQKLIAIKLNICKHEAENEKIALQIGSS